MRREERILADIAAFAPVGGDWRPIDALGAALWQVGVRPEHLPVLFGVFERYPDESEAPLWGILHLIEALPFDYEAELLASIERVPAELNLLMVNRIANTGQPTVAGRAVLAIFDDLLQRPGLPDARRRRVEGLRTYRLAQRGASS